MSNAIDLISAYNRIDARLRAIYRGKGNLNFTDLVRRCAEFQPTVHKYEEELLSCARLRNAIVHNSTSERVIAEPCDDFTRLILRIADLLCAPPRLAVFKDKTVTGISSSATVGEAFLISLKRDYSNLPVYEKDRMIGILNGRRLVRAVGEALDRGEDVNEFLRKPCREVVCAEDMARFYRVLGRDDTVQEAVDAFSDNRKLLAVVVTERGGAADRIVNILTASDLPKLISVLEDGD